MKNNRQIRRALLSVFDKEKIIDFARNLSLRGVELLATEGTAFLLKKNKLSVIEISDYISFPEIMEGKIKTLHPKIHGGILGNRERDVNIMNCHGILPIDMVVVNFYPFSKIISCNKYSPEDIIKNIDIGGPTMARSAAKNYKDVTIIVNNADYDTIIKELDANQGSIMLSTRFILATQAFEYISVYDNEISNYFSKLIPDFYENKKKSTSYFPNTLKLSFIKKKDLRYGENHHQRAAFYINKDIKEVSISTVKQLQGKSLSYNNITDADTALECVKEFKEPACVIVKHENPCGVAISDSILNAYDRAYKTDPTSAFGGIIAFNRKLNSETAQKIISRQFVEIIIVPSISEEALQITSFKNNLRILVYGKWTGKRTPNLDFKSVNGGILVQNRDIKVVDSKEFRIVSKRKPNEKELRDALFSWKVVKFVKSNAIVFAKDNTTIGIGAGQMSRTYSAKIAGIKVKENNLNLKDCVMASDAFFSFHDGIDTELGITCIIQPGGSIRDDEIISFVDKHNIAMIFTDIRHFRH